MTGRRSRGIRYTAVGTGRRVLTEQIRLAVLLCLTGLILIALETTLLSHIPLPFFGWQAAAPALSLLFPMAVGFIHGEREGGITGLLCGWIADSAGTGTSSFGMLLLPLLYFLCGYLSGTVGKRRLAHNLPSFTVFAAVGGSVKCLLYLGLSALDRGSFPPAAYVWRGTVPHLVLTVLFSVAVYGIVRGEQWILKPRA